MNHTKPEFNQIIRDPLLDLDILINECTRNGVTSFPSMSEAYDREYRNCNPETEITEKLTDLLKNISITIVLGTWCKDSQIEVPRFLKVADMSNVSDTAMEFIAVDKNKSAKPDLINDLSITNVPTFIVKHFGEEIGRIVEHPIVDLVSDLLYIIEQK